MAASTSENVHVALQQVQLVASLSVDILTLELEELDVVVAVEIHGVAALGDALAQ